MLTMKMESDIETNIDLNEENKNKKILRQRMTQELQM